MDADQVRDTPRAVIFDCDGVLLVSNRLKTAVFGEALASLGYHARDVARFQAFQAANFGMSRYRLFEALLGWTDLVAAPAGMTRDRLIGAYADRLYGRYVKCASTPGMLPVLEGLRQRGIPLFVVSGSDERELRAVLAERGLARHFAAIHGSPATKTENLQLVAAALGTGFPMADCVFIGDAEADWKAAEAAGARFVYMDHYSTAKPRMRELQAARGFPMIRDLRSLPAHL
jgi:phosphoglycolate phosphatase-like HAD superfamily hydrolase